MLIGPHLNGLKKIITKWVDAIVEDFDIWEVTIETYEVKNVVRIVRNRNSLEEFHRLPEKKERDFKRSS